MADGLAARYAGTATRAASYVGAGEWRRDSKTIGAWGELAKALRSA